MLVSKIAVIALVAIFAVPILLGYAFNFTETTETGYKKDGNSVNVTPLLQNGVGYTYANGDNYQNNSQFALLSSSKIFPMFESNTTAKTSLKVTQDVKPSGYVPSGTFTMANYDQWAWYFEYNSTNGYINAVLVDDSDNATTINKVHTLFVDYSNNRTVYLTKYSSGYTLAPTGNMINNIKSISFNTTGSYSADKTIQWYDRTVDNKYVNISPGYHFEGGSNYFIQLPAYTRNAVLTMDLSSYTDSSLFMTVTAGPSASNFIIQKTSNHWYVGNSDDWPNNKIELYYDASRTSNTYQISIEYDLTNSDLINDYYTRHIDFKYVGNWPTIIGNANYYQKFSLDYELSVSAGTVPSMNRLQFAVANQADTPVMRLDYTEFRAFTYETIDNQVYKPATYRSNPATTLNDPKIYGSSLIFGGNTYDVTDGKITVNSHQVPVKGLVLSSIPNENGTYDNLIGNTKISTSAQPSTITFVGKWAVSVSTEGMETYSNTKTEWIAGSFGWDGIDHNFLMVGLVTCLGVFIALGIYARKRGTGGIIPLMIVTGCAAAVFFIML